MKMSIYYVSYALKTEHYNYNMNNIKRVKYETKRIKLAELQLVRECE